VATWGICQLAGDVRCGRNALKLGIDRRVGARRDMVEGAVYTGEHRPATGGVAVGVGVGKVNGNVICPPQLGERERFVAIRARAI